MWSASYWTGVGIGATHLAIYAFILGGPFYNDGRVILIHMFACISLMLHWLLNDNTCVLTHLESVLRQCDHSETLTHILFAPVLESDRAIVLVTFFLFILSSIKAHHPEMMAGAS